MSDLNVDGMAIAPSVVETIVSIAAKEVEGVACIGSSAVGGYIYPKINISNKKRVCADFLDMLPKQIKVNSNGITNTIDGYQF